MVPTEKVGMQLGVQSGMNLGLTELGRGLPPRSAHFPAP
jgi:hypothetical protein